MKVGDLVRYFNSAYPSMLIGIILEIDDVGDGSGYMPSSPYRVRWIDHTESTRDWYGKLELTRINLTQRSK